MPFNIELTVVISDFKAKKIAEGIEVDQKIQVATDRPKKKGIK
jgi:hypothetical protein